MGRRVNRLKLFQTSQKKCLKNDRKRPPKIFIWLPAKPAIKHQSESNERVKLDSFSRIINTWFNYLALIDS